MRLAAALLAMGTLIAAESGVYLDVPFVKQDRYACGAASIAMVMQYWQAQSGQPLAAKAESIQKELYSADAHGIYTKDLEAYLRRSGYRTFALRGTWDDLREHLAKGRPLIVALQPARDDFHYVVITGLDWENNIVLKHDPAQRRLLKQHRADFEKEWKAAGNWTLLALPKENPSSSAH